MSLLAFLALFAALLLAQPLLLARAKGMSHVMGNRDDAADMNHPAIGRLDRTVRNTIEAAVLFVPLVLASEVLGASNALTQFGAFVAARVAYAAVYALGITGVRSLVWNAGLGALAVIAAGLVVA
ncbi:MAG: MAPEG family protein [Pseudomonadota bacterium]